MPLIKETKKLFMDKYGYKISFVHPAAGWFRGDNLPHVKDKIKNFNFGGTDYISRRIKTIGDLNYCSLICDALSTMSDYEIRIETPMINFYTNTANDIDKLAKLAGDNIKYISKPPTNVVLAERTVRMRRNGYDYKVTLGSTKQSYNDFVEWAETTGLAKLTKSCKRELGSDYSWGGTYFYVKHDKALTMTKMFLGSCISRVDQVIASDV